MLNRVVDILSVAEPHDDVEVITQHGLLDHLLFALVPDDVYNVEVVHQVVHRSLGQLFVFLMLLRSTKTFEWISRHFVRFRG